MAASASTPALTNNAGDPSVNQRAATLATANLHVMLMSAIISTTGSLAGRSAPLGDVVRLAYAPSRHCIAWASRAGPRRGARGCSATS
jgi:hypothetical protein